MDCRMPYNKKSNEFLPGEVARKIVGRQDLTSKQAIDLAVDAGFIYRPDTPAKGYRVTGEGQRIGGRESHKISTNRYDVVFQDTPEIRRVYQP